MTEYQPPEVVASYEIDSLVEHAASCIKYGESDVNLKEDIALIDKPLGGLKRLRSR